MINVDSTGIVLPNVLRIDYRGLRIEAESPVWRLQKQSSQEMMDLWSSLIAVEVLTIFGRLSRQDLLSVDCRVCEKKRRQG